MESSEGMGHQFQPVKSAMRALDILTTISRAPTDGMTFAEIERAMGWPRSSTYNLIQTLTRADFLQFSDHDRRYRVGIRLWETGQRFARDRDLGRIAQRFLADASTRLNETTQLAILDGRHNIYIAKVEAEHHLKLASEVGSRLPAHATGLGKALLSGLDGPGLRELYAGVELDRFTDQTIDTIEGLEAELERIRARGYATDHGEFTVGVYCVAVPVRDQSGSVIAAISSSAPEPRVDEGLRLRMAEVLSKTAQDLSEALGYRHGSELAERPTGTESRS